MKIKRIINCALCIALSAVIAFSSSAFAVENQDEETAEQTAVNEDLESLREKGDELTAAQIEINQALDKARQDAAQQEELRNALQAKIDSIQEQIDVKNKTIELYTDEIEKLSDEVKRLEAQIEEDYELLRTRIKTIYMAGQASTIELLLCAKDFTDFIDKANLIKSLSRQDKKLIDELKASLSDINKKRDKVKSDRAEVEKAKETLSKQRDELSVLQKECDSTIAKLKGETERLEKQKQEAEKEQSALSEKLSQWHSQYVAQNGTTLSSASGDASKYTWPAPECQIITSYWGDSRGHKGLDIACNGSAYGSPIVAAADGTVQIANSYDSWGGGWGYYIMIDHGNGFATLYAHCSLVAVSEGEAVKAGEVIGYIGNSGNSFGAHLHFECWFDGTQYDPAIRFNI